MNNIIETPQPPLGSETTLTEESHLQGTNPKERSSQEFKRILQLFPNYPRNLLLQFKYDNEAVFSVTNQIISDEIVRCLVYLGAKETDKVVDSTACIGGNVFSFTNYFKTIYAIEWSKKKVGMLKANLDILDDNYSTFEKSRVSVIHGNCLDYILPESSYFIQSDILFIDPPWGGTNYKERTIMDLWIYKNSHTPSDRLELFEIISKVADGDSPPKFIVLKVPLNYNLNNIQKVNEKYKVETIKGYDSPNSMLIIFLSITDQQG
jgi:16S rRNA G966 N2-methylase RsmD